MEDEVQCPCHEDLCLFLSKYSAWLMGSGATCIRVEKNVKRIARAYGMEVELFIMPRHVHITLWKEGSTETLNSIATVNHAAINFNVNTLLSQLSWEIADGKISFNDALNRFKTIVHNQHQNKWLVLGLVGLANASFCRLFGGGPCSHADSVSCNNHRIFPQNTDVVSSCGFQGSCFGVLVRICARCFGSCQFAIDINTGSGGWYECSISCAGHPVPEFFQRPALSTLYMLVQPIYRCVGADMLSVDRYMRRNVFNAPKYVLIWR